MTDKKKRGVKVTAENETGMGEKDLIRAFNHRKPVFLSCEAAMFKPKR